MKIIFSKDIKDKLQSIAINILMILIFAAGGYFLPFIKRDDFIIKEPNSYFEISYFIMSIFESLVFITILFILGYAAAKTLKYIRKNITIDKSN